MIFKAMHRKNQSIPPKKVKVNLKAETKQNFFPTLNQGGAENIKAHRMIHKVVSLARLKQPKQKKQPKENPEEHTKLFLSSGIYNAQIVTDHFEDIKLDMLNRESDANAVYCLKIHAISPLLRAKMVNWMVEVLNTFECDDQTFFLAVNIMDLYYYHSCLYYYFRFNI